MNGDSDCNLKNARALLSDALDPEHPEPWVLIEEARDIIDGEINDLEL